MSRRLLENARRRLAAEEGPAPHSWGGRLSVALVYPNTYHQAMSNLGFQWVHHALNRRPDCLCERFFLPDAADLAEHRKTGFSLFSLESARPLSDFDLIAFSISFENDYLHLPILFDLARIPLWAVERGDDFPLVMCGGVCAFLNPEPLAEIMDLFAVGEGEKILPDLLDTLQGGCGDREILLDKLCRKPGIYVPSRYSIEYHEDGTLAAYESIPPAPEHVRRQWLGRLDESQSRTFIHTDDTEFGDMSLVEISRGCGRGCRFCAAGYIYLPPRERSAAALTGQFAEGLCHRQKLGLVSAAVSDHSAIADLEHQIQQAGGQISVSSLRIDSLTAGEVAALKESGHRTVALAPEAGSQRLRNFINKGFDEEQILAAVQLVVEGGIPNLKLYFLLGLPTECEADLAELLSLTEKIRSLWLAEGKKRGRLGQLTLSVNPFIPKPFTPLQWAAMASQADLKKRFRKIRAAIGRLPNTEVIFESLRGAELQAFLARGDRRTGRTLPSLAAGDNLRKACKQAGLDAGFYVTRERGAEELFPWEVIDSGVDRHYLWQEYLRAAEGQLTSPCVSGCQRCGICKKDPNPA
ncbi:radical SAM protein [Syntrophotalea acetylenivorans]|uniref:Radical SAM protein n=1 Tax=Syntrophotalea acetylenivorans TaxID=1842532 RepID=A0A1L3GSF6_9BACT|nr:radical SAM protein [Syntrophotalea acetylenivorans]APG28884.1 radical SAM protein [Syntrophotalea acetylenivorans]